ncbi:cryptochrome/photolyase family protein [Saccharibacter floricola]|uniref:Deoxyribodipyrimidine photolyase n=1 Tax=Saccharibacter floricola DSM 15669 TaxID=1123227 RepID=A0ABQ0NZ84_9PROT|nr:deoxyribodipyrimidine photo-lyase [Saccharibacter floricola]GBQ07173.1 deoxyribodipyrimidine photolyase [Saccharibacter floricola DSM 15669]
MVQRPTLLWFRDDLRLDDHPALYEAAQIGRPLLCVFILENGQTALPPLGGAAHWWLHGALSSLRHALEERGGTLITLRGEAETLIPALARATQAASVHTHARFHERERAQEDRIAQALPDQVALHKYWGTVLLSPNTVATKSGASYRVFTPFWKALQQHPIPTPLPIPRTLQFFALPDDVLSEYRFDEETLRPHHPDWAEGLRERWDTSLIAAHEQLDDFITHDLAHYETDRNLMGQEGTSCLSPRLAWGQLSPRRVWHTVRQSGKSQPDTRCYLSELAWRDFARYTLYHTPDLPFRNLNQKFDRMPWRNDPKALRAWQQGRTGIPIVDAGMRELWHTGWMHNRARMIVGSFLTRHLLIHWREGEAWFRDTLIDADHASNSMNWQWVSGTGIDATPFFRIFNPTLQAEKFDPHGDYIRTWVPELRSLSGKELREPWTAPSLFKTDYPAPIIDLKEGRARALDALRSL